eukprot:jgi/Astpho2/6032/e_gw1.00084.157.1_t
MHRLQCQSQALLDPELIEEIDRGSDTFQQQILSQATALACRAAVGAIVREKELRLREGMRILGLKGFAYWSSWALTHFAVMAASGTICATIGLYPFRHSSFVIMVAFFWLVACALLSFAYFLSTLFSKSRIATTAVALLYSVAMMPGYLMPSLQPYGGLGWTLACLLPPSCISLFASAIIKFETAQRGITWDSLAVPVTSEHPFSAATVFQMLLLDVVLYGVLTWYLDQVWPSDVGQRQPWYFFVLPSYWSEGKPTGDPAVGAHKEANALSLLLRPTAGAAAVRISDLHKDFRTTDGRVKHAVDGLSLDIQSGQITGLLGHNGAGKTTTISMLTGVTPPTSGSALIKGLSVSTQMARIRQDLGVCPQFDILWPEMTVLEHLLLHGAIKGFSGTDRHEAAEAAAQDVGLHEKMGCRARDLSGGQRRKLSVAIAFLGSPAVVFLDECTSGMDPYSRRFTWDVIKRHRDQCAIVLTTHSMEEADILCDRIAIMVDGRLAADGTPLDLKAKFGVGYTLTIVTDQPVAAEPGQPSADLKGLDDMITRKVPTAQRSAAAGSEVSYKLPKDEASRFPELLRQLDDSKQRLGVASYGLAVTTLEEVFLKSSQTLLCMTMMAAVLSASFAVFLVRERENNSKQVQMISGASASAFWLATYVWDLLNFIIPAAGILLCFVLFNLPQFRGARLVAVTGLLGLFGVAALPLTYCLHFLFNDEMKALQYINTGAFLVGYLGFLATFILDQIYTYFRVAGVVRPNSIVKHTLRTVSPHFNLARGLYDISATYDPSHRMPDKSPWTWSASGLTFFLLCSPDVIKVPAAMCLSSAPMGFLACCLCFGHHRCTACCSVVDCALMHTAVYRLQRAAQGVQRSSQSGEGDAASQEAQRLLQMSGCCLLADAPSISSQHVVVEGLQKRFSQGFRRPPLRAVDGLWLGIPAGQCFGLLGVNGAGKSTTFKMVTGELLPDGGDAYIQGLSVSRQRQQARQMLGYCPQFDALPGHLTGREVLRLYARLRGVGPANREQAIEQLLTRIGLQQYSDRTCDSYSGGNKRKLSVAIALVGDPPVVLADEPSTGVDPSAKRFLWGIIQKQLIDSGCTVMMTSHSMEECEALCACIGIMASGRLRCLGTVQHLKNRFGAG